LTTPSLLSPIAAPTSALSLFPRTAFEFSRKRSRELESTMGRSDWGEPDKEIKININQKT
jgi:hypothetical protein